MQLQLFRANQRGTTTLPWLVSKHHFSFGAYFEPTRRSFGALTLCNHDRISTGAGYSGQRHEAIELISIVTAGQLTHHDSTGAASTLYEYGVQKVGAGTGIQHDEHNNSQHELLTVLHIGITPKTVSAPSYEHAQLELTANKFIPVAAPTKKDAALTIEQDAYIQLATLDAERELSYTFSHYRHGAFIYVLAGTLKVEGMTLNREDAIAISETATVKVRAEGNSTFVLIDVPLS